MAKTWPWDKAGFRLENLNDVDLSGIQEGQTLIRSGGGFIPGTPSGQGAPGEDGREVELQKNTTHIQWRYVGDVEWTDLVALADLKGEDGEQGIPGVSADPWTFVKLAEDFVSSLSANTAIPGFKFTPQANKTYLVLGTFMLRTATTTVGARPGIAWPSGLTDATARVEAANSLTVSALQLFGAQTTKNAASTGLATTTHSHYGGFEALLVVGASPSGDFQITLASETAGTNVTMKAGSFFMYREI